MISRIDHIGIAVRDLEAQVIFYRDILGLEFLGFESLPDRGLKVGIFNINGVKIELLSSVSPDSAIGKFIDKKGEGIHHIALRTDNIRDELKHLEEKGIRLIDREPKPGAHGMEVAFLHPGSTFKVLLELCKGEE